jgi:ribosome-associated protein
MDIHSLQAIVIDALEDIKAQDIKLFDTVPLTSLFDRVAIVSGTSNRQTRALAAHVRDKVKQAGGDVISVEGEETGEWVLVDLGDMVVHVMQPTIRSYYNLEELWGEHPIDYKATKKNISRRSASPAEASPADEAASPKAPIARKGSAKKPAYEKGESSKAKKGDAASTKPATTAARKPKTASKGEALSLADTSADFNAIGATKPTPKTLPWRAAADKPGKTASKSPGTKTSSARSGAKPSVKATAPKTPRILPSKAAASVASKSASKAGSRSVASKSGTSKPAGVKTAPAKRSTAKP